MIHISDIYIVVSALHRKRLSSSKPHDFQQGLGTNSEPKHGVNDIEWDKEGEATQNPDQGVNHDDVGKTTSRPKT